MDANRNKIATEKLGKEIINFDKDLDQIENK